MDIKNITIGSDTTAGSVVADINSNFGKVNVEMEKYKTNLYNKGSYKDAAALTAAIPSPKVGDFANVGGLKYECQVAGTWTNTNIAITITTTDISSSFGTSDTKAVSQNLFSKSVSEYNVSILFPTSGVKADGTAGGPYYTLETAVAILPEIIAQLGGQIKKGIKLSFYDINYNFLIYKYIGGIISADNFKEGDKNGYCKNNSVDVAINELLLIGHTTELLISSFSVDTQVSVVIKNSIGDIVARLSLSSYLADTIYKIDEYNNSGVYGYIILTGKEVNVSGVNYPLSNKCYDMSYNGIISAYLNDNVNQYIIDNSTFTVSAQPKVNASIRELYIRSSNLTDIFSIYLLRYDSTAKTCNVYLQKNGVNFSKLYISDGTLNAEQIYEMQIIDGSTDRAFIVFNDNCSLDASFSPSLQLNSRVRSYSANPIIESNILNLLDSASHISKINFCKNTIVDKYITELYIPSINDYGKCKITRLYAKETELRLFIKKANGDFLCVEGRDVTSKYYEHGSVMTLYDKSTAAHDIIGYAIINYSGSDYAVDVNVELYQDKVANVDNSPTIKSIIEGNEQIILSGDSLFGQPSRNSLSDIMRGILGKQVLNIGCGGCRMSLRTTDGSSYYDKFSFVSLADAIASNSFNAQELAIQNKDASDTSYIYQLQDMKAIDMSKPTIILCDYITNDVTSSVNIGDLWTYDSTTYDKLTFLGAMNYGIKKLLTQYPLLKIVFITDMYRWRPLSDSTSVPPYAYVNSIGKSGIDYSNAEKENCDRLGLVCVDYRGVRNAFSMDSVTLDATHNNPYGFHELAKFLCQLVEEYK